MLITALALTATTASKWLIAGKIMSVVGTGLLTVSPAIEKMKKEREWESDKERGK